MSNLLLICGSSSIPFTQLVWSGEVFPSRGGVRDVSSGNGLRSSAPAGGTRRDSGRLGQVAGDSSAWPWEGLPSTCHAHPIPSLPTSGKDLERRRIQFELP